MVNSWFVFYTADYQFGVLSQCDFDRLVVSTNPFVERKFEFLIECMNDLSMEQAEGMQFLVATSIR
jgi:hypothetical protein